MSERERASEHSELKAEILEKQTLKANLASSDIYETEIWTKNGTSVAHFKIWDDQVELSEI